MRAVAFGLLLLPAVVAADAPRYLTTLDVRVDDPDKKVTGETLSAPLRTADGTTLDACWKKPGTMKVAVVLDKGKVTSVTASGSGDPDVDTCVARALRAITLASSASRVTATLELSGVVQAPPKVGILQSKDRKVLESIIDRNLTTSLGKFTGVKGGKGLGTGAGSGTGVGTRAGAGAGAGGSKVEGDFVGKGRIDPGPQQREVRLDARQPPAGDLNERTPEEIQRVILSRAGIFRACYQKELNRTPGIAGKVVMKFTIQPDGSVSRVTADPAKTTLDSQTVIDCVKANVSRLRFPPKEGLSQVTFPFEFSAG